MNMDQYESLILSRVHPGDTWQGFFFLSAFSFPAVYISGKNDEPRRLQHMNDKEIYEILVREHEKMLHAYVVGLVRDHALAEDVCQDAFIKAYQKLSTLKDKGAFPAWLRSIARNTAFTALEKRGREVPMEQEILEGMEDVFQAFDRSARGESWQERVTVIRECLDALPEGMRSVCRAHYFDDRKAQEIAADNGLSVATVFKRLERARDAIRACFEQKMLAGA